MLYIMSEPAENAHKCPEGNTKTSGRYRSYVFTSYKEEKPFFDEVKVKYLAYGSEHCPTTNRHHWQGFVYFFDKYSLKQAQTILKIGNSWMEFMKGELCHNETYCSKEQHYSHFGTKPKQGRRVDLEEITDQIKEGKISVDEIALQTPMLYHQYGRTLEKVEEIVNRRRFRTWRTECDWHWGPTGTGKTHVWKSIWDPDKCYKLILSDNGFWNGYTGQEIVVINEFRGQIPYGELLDLIDDAPQFVKIKGRATTPFLAKRIIITSPMKPEEVYHNLAESDELEQLNDRITLHHHVIRYSRKSTVI